MKKSTWFVLGILVGTYATKKSFDAMIDFLTKRGVMYYEIRTPKDEIKTVGTPLNKELEKEETSDE